jgi:hypothetical protein
MILSFVSSLQDIIPSFNSSFNQPAPTPIPWYKIIPKNFGQLLNILDIWSSKKFSVSLSKFNISQDKYSLEEPLLREMKV